MTYAEVYERRFADVSRAECPGEIGVQASPTDPDRAEAICCRCGAHLVLTRTGPQGNWWVARESPPDPHAEPPRSPKKARRRFRRQTTDPTVAEAEP